MGVQCCQVEKACASGLGGELGCCVGVVDGAGIDGVDPGTVEMPAFLKEGAALGKEEGKGLIDVNLARVGFHLAEIGIEGDLGRGAGADPVAGAE